MGSKVPAAAVPDANAAPVTDLIKDHAGRYCDTLRNADAPTSIHRIRIGEPRLLNELAD